MHSIMLMNAKGGSGKSTLATTLAAYYAEQGKKVVLADYDPQGSCMDWLKVRPKSAKRIHGVHAVSRSVKVTRDTDYLIIDAPGAVHGRAIGRLVKKIDSLIVPVTPSPVDVRAAARFIQELLLVRRVSRLEVRIGLVANRVRPSSSGFESLARFLDRLNIPVAGLISDSDNYIHAAGVGQSIFEMEREGIHRDREEWQHLLDWLDGHPPSLDLVGLGEETEPFDADAVDRLDLEAS